MYAIINSSNSVIGVCDLPPDADDLASRGEQSVEVTTAPAIGAVYDGAGFTTPAPSLDEAKAAKRAEMRAMASAWIQAGVQSSVLGAPHTYPTKPTDQQNLAGLAQQANIDGIGAKFWCADEAGVWARRDHTAAQLIQLGREVIAHVQAQQDRYEALLGQIEAAATVADVEAILW